MLVPLLWPLSSNSPRQNGEEIKIMSQTLRFHWKSPLRQAILESTASLFTMNSTGPHTYSLCVCVCVCTVCPAVSGWIIHCGAMMKQLDYSVSASSYTLLQPEYWRIHLFSRTGRSLQQFNSRSSEIVKYLQPIHDKLLVKLLLSVDSFFDIILRAYAFC